MIRMRHWLPDISLLARSASTAAILFLRLCTQAAGLLLLVRALGPSEYGTLAAATALAVVLGLLPSLGAGYVLLSRTATSDDACQDVWSYSWPLTTVIGLVMTPLFAWACNALAAGDTVSAALLLLLGGSELVFTPITLVLSFIVQAKDRVALSQIVQWAPLALKVVAAAASFLVEPSNRLLAYICLQCAASAIGTFVAWSVARRLALLHMRPRLARRSEISAGSAYGFMHFVAANPSELDKIISLRALGATDAGVYAASARIMGAMVMPVTALLLSVQAKLFRHAATASAEARPLIRQVGGAAAIWGGLSCILLIATSHWMPLIFGQGFQRSATFMPWLALAAPMIALRVTAGTILVSHGHPLQRACFEIGGSAILCVCMFGFTRYGGLNGAAAALIVAEASMAIVGWAMLLRRRKDVSPKGPARD